MTVVDDGGFGHVSSGRGEDVVDLCAGRGAFEGVVGTHVRGVGMQEPEGVDQPGRRRDCLRFEARVGPQTLDVEYDGVVFAGVEISRQD